MYHYSVPPQGYVRYEQTSPRSSPSSSPAPEQTYTYYISQPYKSPPPKEYRRHSRKESMGTPKRPGGWHSADYPSPSYYARHQDHTSPPGRREEHVSRDFERVYVKTRRYSSTAATHGGVNWGSNGYSSGDSRGTDYGYTNRAGSRPHTRHASVQEPSRMRSQRNIIIDTSDSADDSPSFGFIKPRKQAPPPKPKYSSPSQRKTNDRFLFTQATSSRDDSHRRSSGHARRPSSSHHAKPSKPLERPREATPKDALKHGIPAGFSLKNWDPEESPVMLLGSVFDANSLGKWIYDWTVFHHSANSPMSEVAGDLWLLLIKLAHKMKRADECLPRVADDEDYEMVEDFLESGDRLWARMKKLLKQCEEFMWKAAKKEGTKSGSGSSGSVKMGKNSGCEFVDSIFGRDRMLEDTESLMQSIRLWNMRFDANCEDILRHPRG